MKIDRHMNLGALAEHMGDCATPAEAAEMRSLLTSQPWRDTQDIPEFAWRELITLATSAVRAMEDIW